MSSKGERFGAMSSFHVPSVTPSFFSVSIKPTGVQDSLDLVLSMLQRATLAITAIVVFSDVSRAFVENSLSLLFNIPNLFSIKSELAIIENSFHIRRVFESKWFRAMSGLPKWFRTSWNWMWFR